MNYTLDCRKKACPQPVIDTKNTIESGKYSSLNILVDNEAAKQNVSRFLTNFNHVVKAVNTVGNNEFEIIVELNNEAEKKDVDFNEFQCVVPQHIDGKVIFIASEEVGKGDDLLGKKLMQAFLFTLTELDHKPSTIIFMNAGVKLCVASSESLKNLKKLEQDGIEMLVCGTCLDYFDLTSALRVGTISNMYNIAEKLLDDSKVIKI